MTQFIWHGGFYLYKAVSEFTVSGLNAGSMFLSFKQENVNEPISAKKRKRTLEIMAYSTKWTILQNSGVAWQVCV